ncbi:MAG: FtsW/RodA/SpoVE family cell cycle protein [Nitriliruptorales bacterium]|nr:FtsW/RodA/SpoVE family cell cycle protein [Nitriliruptorales bacterium]
MSVAAPTAGSEQGKREARRRSNAELRLLILALTTILIAYTLVGLAELETIPAGLGVYVGAMAALAVTAHLVSRRLAPGADPILLPTAFLLNGLGLVMVRRLDFARDVTLAPAQTLWTVVAIGAFCATLLFLRDHGALDRYRYLIGIGALILLMLPLLPVIGVEVNGARIWVRLGSLRFQPGEFAKLALVAFFASYLAEKRALLTVATNRLGPVPVPPARAFGPVILAWGVSLSVLVFQNDLGVSLLIFSLFIAMLYVSTGRAAYVIIAGLLFSAGAFAAWTLLGHVQRRVTAWLSPFEDPEGAGFQIVQSLYALAAGGITGVGWGHGRAPDLIPAVETDFIFAAFGEELGLLGTTALLLCFMVLVSRGFHTALRARDDFSTLLATGVTVVLGLQVFIILGGVTRLIPLTGLTLPFISYGGSSLVANYVLVALLLRISSANRS